MSNAKIYVSYDVQPGQEYGSKSNLRYTSKEQFKGSDFKTLSSYCQPRIRIECEKLPRLNEFNSFLQGALISTINNNTSSNQFIWYLNQFINPLSSNWESALNRSYIDLISERIRTKIQVGENEWNKSLDYYNNYLQGVQSGIPAMLLRQQTTLYCLQDLDIECRLNLTDKYWQEQEEAVQNNQQVAQETEGEVAQPQENETPENNQSLGDIVNNHNELTGFLGNIIKDNFMRTCNLHVLNQVVRDSIIYGNGFANMSYSEYQHGFQLDYLRVENVFVDTIANCDLERSRFFSWWTLDSTYNFICMLKNSLGNDVQVLPEKGLETKISRGEISEISTGNINSSVFGIGVIENSPILNSANYLSMVSYQIVYFKDPNWTGEDLPDIYYGIMQNTVLIYYANLGIKHYPVIWLTPSLDPNIGIGTSLIVQNMPLIAQHSLLVKEVNNKKVELLAPTVLVNGDDYEYFTFSESGKEENNDYDPNQAFNMVLVEPLQAGAMYQKANQVIVAKRKAMNIIKIAGMQPEINLANCFATPKTPMIESAVKLLLEDVDKIEERLRMLLVSDPTHAMETNSVQGTGGVQQLFDNQTLSQMLPKRNYAAEIYSVVNYMMDYLINDCYDIPITFDDYADSGANMQTIKLSQFKVPQAEAKKMLSIAKIKWLNYKDEEKKEQNAKIHASVGNALQNNQSITPEQMQNMLPFKNKNESRQGLRNDIDKNQGMSYKQQVLHEQNKELAQLKGMKGQQGATEGQGAFNMNNIEKQNNV